MIKRTAKDLWMPKRRIEARYKKALNKITKKITKVLEGITSAFQITKTLRNLTNSEEFKDYAKSSAMKMVTALFTDAGRTWREAAKVNTKGNEIYKELKEETKGPIGGYVTEQIQRNAELIKSLPLDISREITEYIGQETIKGRTSESIAIDLKKKIPSMSSKKATLIARTEVSKTNTALIKARAMNIGLNWYIWKTCKDQRVRKSHDHMDGVLINWNDAPSPEKLAGEKHIGYYDAGNVFNCRCYPAPIVNLKQIKFPCKVHYRGKIQTMTKIQFEEIM